MTKAATFRPTLSRASARRVARLSTEWTFFRLSVDRLPVRLSSQLSTSSALSLLSLVAPISGIRFFSASMRYVVTVLASNSLVPLSSQSVTASATV
ncbi:MAG: hypothetical protein ACXVGG_13970 [Mycobacteriaceae bacterium]